MLLVFVLPFHTFLAFFPGNRERFLSAGCTTLRRRAAPTTDTASDAARPPSPRRDKHNTTCTKNHHPTITMTTTRPPTRLQPSPRSWPPRTPSTTGRLLPATTRRRPPSSLLSTGRDLLTPCPLSCCPSGRCTLTMAPVAGSGGPLGHPPTTRDENPSKKTLLTPSDIRVATLLCFLSGRVEYLLTT